MSGKRTGDVGSQRYDNRVVKNYESKGLMNHLKSLTQGRNVIAAERLCGNEISL